MVSDPKSPVAGTLTAEAFSEALHFKYESTSCFRRDDINYLNSQPWRRPVHRNQGLDIDARPRYRILVALDQHFWHQPQVL